MKIEDKIARLDDAVPPLKGKVKAAQEMRYHKIDWKLNPLAIVPTPEAVRAFRKLGRKLRRRMWRRLAIEKEFNPSKLVTYQLLVNSQAVLKFAKCPSICRRKKAYVLNTKDGPCVWNGNHRAAAALVANRKFKAMYLDLTR